MNRRNQNKKTESDFREFIEYRKGMSAFDKKLEAAKLIDQTTSIDIDEAYHTVTRKINQGNRVFSIFTTLTRVAATLTLPLLAFAIWSLFFQKNEKAPVEMAQNEITWQSITSPAGMRSHIVLPDGTNLWLNAGSKVKYGIPFTRKKREITLSGEAYLEVAENKKSPFVVNTETALVEVLGTQFNVNAYPESDRVEVALREGKVKFSFSDDEKVKYAELSPNDFLQFDKKRKTVNLDNTDIKKYIAWHQNILILDETPMPEVARLLEQWYGVKVIIKNEEIKKYRFTTTFDNEPLFRVLELLELSSPSVKTTYTPGKPDKDSKKLSPSIVTITKKQLPM
ncbi:FecR family protein [Mariniphaga sediminis]|jgi:ferric-dicitrate binding protein FerR (iron transport regulator)|uniref:FecR family protein n=1 Tax=Mariniphaga sediminis TaxID=1628158 RepID=A0A399D123_9BACT|nr:FecR family protein [Mariniphaga sediminis]RIH65564.1 FecR family protein [Mariniphaga sediminis]